MVEVDTSVLDSDPIQDLARQMYAESPFNTGAPWDQLSPDGQAAWYQRGASRWLGDAPRSARL